MYDYCVFWLSDQKKIEKKNSLRILRNNNVDAVNERKTRGVHFHFTECLQSHVGTEKCDAVGSVGVGLVCSLLVPGCVEHVLSAAACFVQTLLI